MRIIRKMIVALIVVMLNFSKQIGCFLQLDNRFLKFWSVWDGVAILLAVALLAAVAVAVSEVLRRAKWERARNVYNHLFVYFLGVGLLSSFPGRMPALAIMLWAVIVVMAATGRWFKQLHLIRRGRALCMILSPLIAILSFQLLTQESWASPAPPPLRFQPGTVPDHPVFVFVFDEWSYPRSTTNGQFLPTLANLRELSTKCVTFKQAYSPSRTTQQSLPAIIYQADGDLEITRGHTLWRSAQLRLNSTKVESIFTVAKRHDYNTALTGFYLPYYAILRDQLDYCRSFPITPTGETLLQKIVVHIATMPYVSADPLVARAGLHLYSWMYSRRWYNINNQILDAAMFQVGNCPGNTLAFFHWPLPHSPYVFSVDGSYHGYSVTFDDRTGGQLEDYQRQLQYLDKVIGLIIQRLRTSGKFDGALLIITSDHAWKEDFSREHHIMDRHVPLLIKLPNQQHAQVISKPIVNNQLGPLISAAIQGKSEARTTAQWLEALPDSVALPTNPR